MLLNSYYFIGFFILFFLMYWVVAKKATEQNTVLLLANFIFYCSWSMSFVGLLAGTIVVTYYVSKKITTQPLEKRKFWLRFGIFIVLGQLLYFKYFNFFIENINTFLESIGFRSSIPLLKIVLPIGISFYSFRMIGYLIDVKNNKIKELPSLLDYSCFISFFPAIIAGPIDKSFPFLSQLKLKREFSNALFTLGLRQILWGLFKKLVIADNLALMTENMSHYHQYNGSSLLLIAVLYFVQLYADFSGYSDMAIGLSKLIGLRIQANFNYPLFAQNVADYWRRWHISLTSWLTEYVFTPLSIHFRDYGKTGLILAIIINFLVVGFWHGAEWHYIVHGLVSGIMFIPLIVRGKMNKKFKSENSIIPTYTEFFNITSTFFLFALLMILFFVKDLNMAVEFYQKIFSASLFSGIDFKIQKEVIILMAAMLCIEWAGRGSEFAFKDLFCKFPRSARWIFYYGILFLIFLFYKAPKGFIYAQF